MVRCQLCESWQDLESTKVRTRARDYIKVRLNYGICVNAKVRDAIHNLNGRNAITHCGFGCIYGKKK